MSDITIGIGLLTFLILLALSFDFIIGFQGAANSITTLVSTGALKPYQAVCWAAGFQCLAILVFTDWPVARTVALGIVEVGLIDHRVVFGALSSALAWSLMTWRFELPSSSSLALIGGLIGAAIARSGPQAIHGTGLLTVAGAIALLPIVAFAISAGLLIAIAWLLRRVPPRYIDRWFTRLQLPTSALYNLARASNDAQKSIGLIWLLLIVCGTSGVQAALPGWVAPACFLCLALGTLLGGWRVVRTMSQKINRLRPAAGFSAETGSAVTLLMASAAGIPMSTTQALTGAIFGADSATKMGTVGWQPASSVLWTWLLTLPGSAILAALAWWMSGYLF
jgi:PiT family inorganic phosphate transporter